MGIHTFTMSYCACQVVTRGKSSQVYEDVAEKKMIEWILKDVTRQRRDCIKSIRVVCAKQGMDIHTGVAHMLACMLQDDHLQHNTLWQRNNKIPYILLIFFVYLFDHIATLL